MDNGEFEELLEFQKLLGSYLLSIIHSPFSINKPAFLSYFFVSIIFGSFMPILFLKSYL
jgi:hypothetical protein